MGIAGPGVFMAKRLRGSGPTPVDIGEVGEVQACYTDEILRIIASETVPVISPLGREMDTGKTLNINADLAAAALAGAAAAPCAMASVHAQPVCLILRPRPLPAPQTPARPAPSAILFFYVSGYVGYLDYHVSLKGLLCLSVSIGGGATTKLNEALHSG